MMKKSLLLCALLGAWSLGMSAQTKVKAQSLYDVNQDDKVTISDVNIVVKKVVENGSTDKTVVDTEALLVVLTKISDDLAKIKAKLGIEDDATDTHEYVDLALPSKTLWATCNVGADSPEDYGDYFAWGETIPQSSNSYSWLSYKWCKGTSTTHTKYCIDSDFGTVDNKTELETSDDAATANWGSNWCMPTYAQLNELRTYCTWSWITQNEVNGYKVEGTNGSFIFLPAAGFRSDSSLNSVGTFGGYWSRTLDSTTSPAAFNLNFDSSNIFTSDYARNIGFTVRPVLVSK